MTNILIADDHAMFADGIASILKNEDSIKVVGRCLDGPSVIDFLKSNTVDILLLDVNLPGMSGIDVCKEVTANFKSTKVLAISMFNEESFVTEIKPSLISHFGYKNVMQVPKVDKIVLNMGVGEASQDKKKIESAFNEMTLISGQKPIVTRARKSIASFKLRDGMVVGCKVTLRGDKMFEFLDRLINIALPRVRDFRGISKKVLMAMVILLWVSRSRLYSQKSTMIKLIKFEVWTLLSVQRLRPMRRVFSFSKVLICLLVTKLIAET